MSPVWLKHVYSVLCALTWSPMPAAARSKLCSSVSAWLDAFVRIAVTGVVSVGNYFCGVPSASFLCQLEAVLFYFINRCSTVGGVGILIGPRALKSFNSIERIRPRMMVATFNGNPKATIISCYSPTNVSEETELVAFYDELSSLVRSIPKHNVLVIGGDMNAQIGKKGNNKYNLHNKSNRNGQHLTDW